MTKGDAITVQSLFENGFVHANLITRADGTSLKTSHYLVRRGTVSRPEELHLRIIGQIRARWPKVRILLRADSGFAREELMVWCEENHLD